MPEPSTPSSPAQPSPAASAPAANASPGDYDQAQLETVTKSEGIAKAAQNAAYSGVLNGEGMIAITPADLLAACVSWRQLSNNAVDATNEKKKETGLGVDAETQLRRTVTYLRGKASMKINQNPTWTEPVKAAFRDRYFIGEDIFADGETAGQSAQSVLEHAAADNLPGITPAKLASANSDLEAFNGRDEPQTEQQAAATRLRGQRDAIFTEVMRLRHEIQHAADTGFPWWLQVNQATRRVFLLPAGRPFTS